MSSFSYVIWNYRDTIGRIGYMYLFFDVLNSFITVQIREQQSYRDMQCGK